MIAVRLLRRPDDAEPNPVPIPVAATGAVIGRAPDCDLVLDDPRRLVSRQHASLLPQGGSSALLRCISATLALSVNGRSLAPGDEVVVRIGDVLRIGGFDVAIEAAESPTVLLPDRPRAPHDPTAKPVRAEPPVQATPRPFPDPPAAAPQAQASAFAPVPDRPATPGRLRLNYWFDLDSAADPLGPGSPLPVLDSTTVARLAKGAVRNEAPTVSAPAPSSHRVPEPAAPPSPRREPAAPAAAPSDAAPGAAMPAPVAPVRAAADLESLRQAFLRGAGLDTGTAAPLVALDAAWMEHLGTLLRTATEGTLAQLRSRAVAKRSIRAKGTRIAARENNLLKFAPDTAQALTMLVNVHGMRGFLEPADALRDAHNDLQVHQVAMVAGMRAAVHELISRLGPEATEAAEGPPRALARFVPALRSAALWRRHRQGHKRLLDNLDDDFEAVFGREFLRAYEEQSLLAAASAPVEGTPGPS